MQNKSKTALSKQKGKCATAEQVPVEPKDRLAVVVVLANQHAHDGSRGDGRERPDGVVPGSGVMAQLGWAESTPLRTPQNHFMGENHPRERSVERRRDRRAAPFPMPTRG